MNPAEGIAQLSSKTSGIEPSSMRRGVLRMKGTVRLGGERSCGSTRRNVAPDLDAVNRSPPLGRFVVLGVHRG